MEVSLAIVDRVFKLQPGICDLLLPFDYLCGVWVFSFNKFLGILVDTVITLLSRLDAQLELIEALLNGLKKYRKIHPVRQEVK